MNSYVRLFALSAAAVCAATAQPVVTAVLNNASYALPGLSNSGIARGSLFAVFGTGLAVGSPLTATSFPLSAAMGGTSIRVTVGSTAVDALMIYTTPGQLGAVLPSNTPEGSASMVVTVNGQASRPATFSVVRSAFGTFTANQRGSGPGSIQNASLNSQTVALTSPARPGNTLVMWGTGLGPTTADEARGPVPGDLPIAVEVYVGGKPATVTYKGRSGCCSGIDQVAFVVPAGVEGCYVPVVVKTGDVVSNFATISVAASGNACSDPTGFSAQDLQSAQSTGASRIGFISLDRSASKITIPGAGTMDSKTDNGSGSFTRYELNQLLTSQGGSGQSFAVSMGACSVATFKASDAGFVDPVKATALDAGPFISVTGPKGNKQLAKKDDYYSGELGGGTSFPSIPGVPQVPGLPTAAPDFLEAGDYQINNGAGGSGANAVGAFSVNFKMPQMVTWSNESAVSNVTRSAGQQITWAGGDPGGYVQMMGISSNRDVAAMFICTERTPAGQFTIPGYVLSMLPATSGNNVSFLSVGGVTAQQRFTAPGLDVGYVDARSTTQKTVTYR